jgi:hypothetical protein
VLLALRDALVLSAMRFDFSANPPKPRPPQPCFTDYNPDKPASDAGNTFKLALSITNDLTGGISIKVTVLNFSATGESKSTTGNTLTVSFIQHGLQPIQQAKDKVDAECKYPKQDSKACKDARDALAEAEASETGVGIVK